MRVPYLPGVHGRKPLGAVMQRHHLAMPGLRRPKWVWKPIKNVANAKKTIKLGMPSNALMPARYMILSKTICSKKNAALTV